MKIHVDGDFEKSLKRLRRDFETNVLPSLKRHQFYQSKSQRLRARIQKAIKKQKRIAKKLKNKGL